MRERLQKLLSAAGVASRRKAEEMISAGRVTVNGKPSALGDSADPDLDRIALDGEAVTFGGRQVYLALHKPRGYLCAVSDDRGRRTVTELVRNCGVRVYPVGRLDLDSEGLLLLTNNGDFANRMTHPRFEQEKTYLVSVRGDADAAYMRLTEPVVIDGKATHPAQVSLLESDGERAKLSFTLREGRNRQVRRLCEAAGLTVTRLIRVSEGGITLEGLRPGKWRYLTGQEVSRLRGPEGE